MILGLNWKKERKKEKIIEIKAEPHGGMDPFIILFFAFLNIYKLLICCYIICLKNLSIYRKKLFVTNKVWGGTAADNVGQR